ncbi:phosphotransferase [Rhodococcus sp. NPDC004095]
MTVALQVPREWDELTPDWMTTVLAARHPGARVESVKVEMRDDGTNRRARLALTYAEGDGPATVFVKGCDPDHRELVRYTSGLFHEPRLFASGAALPLDHPVVYTALIHEPDDFVLVMENLIARGADPRDATRPMTVEQAAHGVRGLARLHGAYWGSRLSRNSALSWVEPFVPWGGMELAPLPAAIERLGDSAPPEVRSLTIDHLVENVWIRYVRTLTRSPHQTLLHGDPHIGNSYVLPDGDVGFLDWQVVRRGDFSLDLGYFLQGALTVEDRRRSERELVEEYRAELGLPAGECPSTDEVWLRYRASVAHGLTIWLVTLSAGELWQRPDIAWALAERYSAAYVDLETPKALDAIADRPA